MSFGTESISFGIGDTKVCYFGQHFLQDVLRRQRARRYHGGQTEKFEQTVGQGVEANAKIKKLICSKNWNPTYWQIETGQAVKQIPKHR